MPYQKEILLRGQKLFPLIQKLGKKFEFLFVLFLQIIVIYLLLYLHLKFQEHLIDGDNQPFYYNNLQSFYLIVLDYEYHSVVDR